METLEPGSNFGRYRIDAELGRGGMAVVYRATERQLDRPVALKVIAPEMARDRAFLERFRREALAAASLEHEHVLPVYGAGSVGDVAYLAMRFVEGSDLDELIRVEGRLEPARAVRLVAQVASALDAAHARGLVHRDIKPGNILIGQRSDGEVAYLTDFGVAHILTAAGSLTATGEWIGTPAYAAPEQLRGAPLDARVDVYALGCVLFKALTGRQPYERDSPSALMWAHLEEPPPSVRDLAPEVPAALDAAVQAGMAKSAADRPESAGALALAASVALDDVALPATTPFRAATPLVEADRPRLELRMKVPASPTGLIGRRAELEQLTTLVGGPEVRVLTLVGPGGIGKTRLGIELARRLGSQFADGVGFVELAAITDPELVVPTIAHAIGVAARPGEPLAETLGSTLASAEGLLVLDNFEQVLDAAPALSSLLRDAPRLTLLITSRSPLHIGGEHEYPVRPLSLPEGTEMSSVTGSDAAMLFLERARAARPDFEIAEVTAEAVAQICVRLDGLPLALELAAARIKLLSPDALLRRLGERLPQLGSGPRDMPTRQQTLRSTIDWSHNLLSAPEQVLFRRLGVFVGGFSTEAAEDVCGEALEIDVLEGLEMLIDKSLLQAAPGLAGEPRFSMLETIRDYALECLAASAEERALRDRHAAWCLRLADRAARLVDDASVAAVVDLERPNLRSAVNWLLDTDDGAAAARLALALRDLMEARGYVVEARALFERVGTDPSVPASDAAQALGFATWCAVVVRDYAGARSYVGRLVALAEAAGDPAAHSVALGYAGMIAADEGDRDRARPLLEASVQRARESGDDRVLSAALNNLANIDEDDGDWQGAARHYDESVLIARRTGNAQSIAVELLGLSIACAQTGRLDEAHRHAREAVELAAGLHSPLIHGRALRTYAFFARKQGDSERAVRLLAAATAFEPADVELRSGDLANEEATLEAARAALGEEQVERAWAEGNQLDVEAAIAYATSVQPERGNV
jgi:non-specific serine/threonine protein kinase